MDETGTRLDQIEAVTRALAGDPRSEFVLRSRASVTSDGHRDSARKCRWDLDAVLYAEGHEVRLSSTTGTVVRPFDEKTPWQTPPAPPFAERVAAARAIRAEAAHG